MGVKWLDGGPCCRISDDGHHTLTRAPQHGWPAAFQLFLIHGKVPIRLAIERNVSEADWPVVYRRMMLELEPNA